MTEPIAALSSRPASKRALAIAATLSLCACGSLVQVVDKNGAPVAGARVAPEWELYGDWETTDDEGYARIADRWVGLAYTLEPKALVVRTATDEFHVPYPLPSPVVLPIPRAPAPKQPDASR